MLPRTSYLSSPDTAFRRLYSNSLTPAIERYVEVLEQHYNANAIRHVLSGGGVKTILSYEVTDALLASSACIIAAIEAVNNQNYKAAHDVMTASALYRGVVPDYEGSGEDRQAWFLGEFFRYIKTIYKVEVNDEYCGRDYDEVRCVEASWVPFTLPKHEQSEFGLYLTFVEFAERFATPVTGAMNALFGMGFFTLATRDDLSQVEREIQNEVTSAANQAKDMIRAGVANPGPYLDSECIGYDFSFISYLYADSLRYWIGRMSDNDYTGWIEFRERADTATNPAILHLNSAVASLAYHPMKNRFYGRSCTVEQGVVDIDMSFDDDRVNPLSVSDVRSMAVVLLNVFDSFIETADQTKATLTLAAFKDFAKDFTATVNGKRVALKPVRRGLTRSPFS